MNKLVQEQCLISKVNENVAYCVDDSSGYYGYLLVKHPDGQWITARKLSDTELSRVIEENS